MSTCIRLVHNLFVLLTLENGPRTEVSTPASSAECDEMEGEAGGLEFKGHILKVLV